VLFLPLFLLSIATTPPPRQPFYAMKEFDLYLGKIGGKTTCKVTNDPAYKRVVDAALHVRSHLLNDKVLRSPILSIFDSVYRDQTNWTDLPKDRKNRNTA
jgi:hypothetical protein